MSDKLDHIDKLLLGESPDRNSEDDLIEATKANNECNCDIVGTNAHGHAHDIQSTSLNTNAGTLAKVNHDDIKEESKELETEVTKTSRQKRGVSSGPNDDADRPAKKHSPTKNAKATKITNEDALNEPVTPTKTRVSPRKSTRVSVKKEQSDLERDAATLLALADPVTVIKKGTTVKADTKAKTAEEWDTEATISDKSSESPTNGKASTIDTSVSPVKSPKKAYDQKITVRDTPRKRQAPKAILATPKSIPASWDTAEQADKMLVAMKEEGKDWATIRAAWKEETGQDTAPSTLPNRYNRIKMNMMRLKEGDDVHLLAAKLEVEQKFHSDLWALVANAMEKRGTDRYSSLFLAKAHKQLVADAGANSGILADSEASE